MSEKGNPFWASLFCSSIYTVWSYSIDQIGKKHDKRYSDQGPLHEDGKELPEAHRHFALDDHGSHLGLDVMLLADVAVIEKAPKLEGRSMSMVLTEKR